MCDTVFIVKNPDQNTKKVEVVGPNMGTSDHMTFHCDTSDTEAAASVAEELH